MGQETKISPGLQSRGFQRRRLGPSLTGRVFQTVFEGLSVEFKFLGGCRKRSLTSFINRIPPPPFFLEEPQEFIKRFVGGSPPSALLEKAGPGLIELEAKDITPFCFKNAFEAIGHGLFKIIPGKSLLNLASHGFSQGEEDITVVTQDAVLSTFESIFDMITMGLAGIAAISLFVAGVLIMNVMLVAVSQRTKEIGLLRALGAKQRHIVMLFLAEAVFLSFFGALLGLILGSAGSTLMTVVFPFLDFAAPTWAMVAAVAIAVLSGLLFSILPARRAARLDPVLALAGR